MKYLFEGDDDYGEDYDDDDDDDDDWQTYKSACLALDVPTGNSCINRRWLLFELMTLVTLSATYNMIMIISMMMKTITMTQFVLL